MLKRIPILASLLILVALPALASVDQYVNGSEVIEDGDSMHGIPNDEELFLIHGHNADADDPGDSSVGSDGENPGGEVDHDPPNDAPVPEPATGLLLGVGALGIAGLIRRKRS
jgi:hypothetical protein